MYATIKIAVETTDRAEALIANALSGRDKKDRQQAELAAYSEIDEDYEDLLIAIEDLVDNFSSDLVTVLMTD